MSIKFTDLDRSVSLHVNRSNDAHYRIQKSRTDGESELRSLAASSRLEEAWAYARIKTPDGEIIEFWYEIGVNERPESTGLDIRSGALFDHISADGQIVELSLYHIHPHGLECEDFFNPADAARSASEFTQILNKTSDQIKIDSRAVSLHGVSVMTPNIDLWRSMSSEEKKHLPDQVFHDFFGEKDFTFKDMCMNPASYFHKFSTALASYSYYTKSNF